MALHLADLLWPHAARHAQRPGTGLQQPGRIWDCAAASRLHLARWTLGAEPCGAVWVHTPSSDSTKWLHAAPLRCVDARTLANTSQNAVLLRGCTKQLLTHADVCNLVCFPCRR